jgi:hypothetical protein
MPRKSGSKSKVKDKAESNVKKPSTEETQSEKSENQFDFGGLPQRDLKKNLGCG